MLFIISGRDRANGMADRIAHRTAHRAHYSNLGDDLILAGPYLDEHGEPIGSMIVVRMPDEAAARAHVNADPYVVNGVFATVDLSRWDWFMKRPDGFESQRRAGRAKEDNMSDEFGVIRSPASITFGSGQRRVLPRIAARFGTRFFICSDERIGGDAQLLEIVASLTDAGNAVEIYDRTAPELPRSCVAEASEAARTFGPDAIIGLGGGSCLDLAKLVSLTLSHDGDLSEFYGEYKVPGPTLPVIAMPTTAGTGSEVTPVAVVGDPQRDMKVGISSPYLIPDAAICDPELTLSCPKTLTAIAGADALTHAIEAFTAVTQPDRSDLAVRQVFVGKNALSDVFCRAAIEKLAANLPESVENGGNLAAREEVMMGALLAGLGFGVAGTAAAHALQYPVGAATGTAHGLGVACLMPYVMRYNRREIDDTPREISALCGGPPDAEQGIVAIEALFARIGIAGTLDKLGVAADQLDHMAEQSLMAARLVNNNPRRLDLAGAKAILAAAFSGDARHLN